MKKIMCFFIMLLMVSMVKASGYLDYGISGKQMEFRLGIYNNMDHRLKDLKVTAYIPGLTETYSISPRFNVRSNQKEYVTLIFDIPKDIKQDYYPIIYTIIGKNNLKMRRHTWVYIE